MVKYLYLRSFHPYEVAYSEPRHLEGKTVVAEKKIVLPAGRYTSALRAAGKRTVIRLTEEQVAFLKTKPTFRALAAKGEKEGYVLMDDLPNSLKPTEQLLAEAEEKNAALQAELDALKGTAPKVWTEEELRKLQYHELRKMVVEKGLEPAKGGLKALVEQILKSQEPPVDLNAGGQGA